MAAKKTIQGPYEVIDIGANGHLYEVVEVIDEQKHQHAELRPRKTYLNRQSAYGMCARLNRRWQEDHAMDEPVEPVNLPPMKEEDEAYYQQFGG